MKKIKLSIGLSVAVINYLVTGRYAISGNIL